MKYVFYFVVGLCVLRCVFEYLANPLDTFHTTEYYFIACYLLCPSFFIHLFTFTLFLPVTACSSLIFMVSFVTCSSCKI
jgi:hypothetical protein